MTRLNQLKDAYLIRDLVEGKIRYFWEFTSGERASDLLVSYDAAYDWWKQAVHDAYDGPERRASPFDRRANSVKRASEVKHGQVTVQSYGGRRTTDTPPKIRVDRAEAKIQMLKSQLSHLSDQ
ncbi:MAG: Uncharacterised protein [Marinobacterium sp. xm-d-530]|nr:MAG: Uncharacterised protein [Marinobacterium sp. xm-d-530]